MAKITKKEFSECYEQAKLIFDGKQTKEKAIEILTDASVIGMKKSSATYYVNAYLNMRLGKTYQKTINNDATRYYLEHIYSDNGKEALKIALQALQGHLDYYDSQGKGRLVLLQIMHDFFIDEILNK